MSLVLIHAQAPWGPVSLKAAGSMVEVLAHGVAPAAVLDVGERDPADVVREALRLLPPPMDATGLIPATVEKARNLIAEAFLRVPARVVACDPAKAVPGQPDSHGGPIASDGEADAEFSHQVRAPVRETVDAGMSANERISVRARRPGAEVDARAIRAGLGMTQPEFARAFGLKVATVRDWEQGRTAPDGAARSLLVLIEHRPSMVREVLGRYGLPVGD